MTEIPIATDSQSPVITELVYRLRVRDIMTRDVATCRPADSIRHAQQIMRDRRVSGVPVVDDRRLVGIFSVDDLMETLGANAVDLTIESRMTRSVIVLEEDMPLSFAISYLDKYHFGRFPVLNAHRELVGIVTSRDIIMALLIEINKEVERFEAATAQSESSEGGFRLQYATRPFEFDSAGKLSTEAKRMLRDRGVPAPIVRRVVIAAYELEMNQVVHSVGGTVAVELRHTDGEVQVAASDRGPGIPNIENALTEGFSTATEWVRSLGFGAGMGLPNTRRVADEFSITSDQNGTHVRVVVRVGKEHT